MPLQIAYGKEDNNGKNYFLSEDNPLRFAIKTALQLGKPLLITGEPGCGKTRLANWAAEYLHADEENHHPVPFLNKPFVFDTKSYSSGKDLLYHYDALSHFQNQDKTKKAENYIHLSALGQAIVQSWGRTEAINKLALEGIKNIDEIDGTPHSSVVLIDEIDKGPRDFPNDVLSEIEINSFYLNELDRRIDRNYAAEARILVIITSNEEKKLPDAFLRRCLFYNIPFPSHEELKEIIKKRLSPYFGNGNYKNLDAQYTSALHLFELARTTVINKPPATSELLDWLKVLHLNNVFQSNKRFDKIKDWDEPGKTILKLSLHTLIKNKKDLDLFEQAIFSNTDL